MVICLTTSRREEELDDGDAADEVTRGRTNNAEPYDPDDTRGKEMHHARR